MENTTESPKFLALPRLARLEREPEDFFAFWSAFPRRVGRKDALKAWMQTADARPPLDELLAALAAAALALRWAEPSRASFIPHPATWLRGERWMDEHAAPSTAPVAPAHDPVLVQRRLAAQQAWAQVRAANQRGQRPTQWDDPLTAQVLTKLGGFGIYADMGTRDVPHRQRDFVEAYLAVAAIQPAERARPVLKVVGGMRGAA